MATNILKADVLAVASSLSTLSDAAWVMVLDFVNSFADGDSDYYDGLGLDPKLRKLALCFLAAHIGTMAGTTGSSGATGAVISESAGGLKRTYANPASPAAIADLNRTNYGQQYLAILKMSVGTRGPFLV